MLFHLLLAMAAVVTLAQLIGRAFRHARQPAVVGEMVAGILLGPSLLGRVAPSAEKFLLPPDVGSHLRMISQIGVVLFMFLVGVELDASHLRNRVRSAAAISIAGMVVPLAVGGWLGVVLHGTLAPAGVERGIFSAFFAVAMSVTAFPVLARIVAERRLQRSPLGIMAISCAAIDDASAWCLLAVVVSLAGPRGHGLLTLGLTAVYVIAMLVLVRPFVRELARKEERESPASGGLASMLLLLLLSALTTEWIGIHALFGAFLLGTMIPADGRLAHRVFDKLHDPVRVFLLPVFFAFTGMRTEISLLGGGDAWLTCGLIIVVAFAGKLGGVFLTARFLGMEWRRAAALGVLMNARGLMELVVLNVGLDLGIISASLFTMMVLMALVTTIATGPLLDSIGREETVGSSAEPGTRQAA